MPESAKAKLIHIIKEYQAKLAPITTDNTQASALKHNIAALLAGMLDLFEKQNYNVDLLSLIQTINPNKGEWFPRNLTEPLIPVAKFYFALLSLLSKEEQTHQTFSGALNELTGVPWLKRPVFALVKAGIGSKLEEIKQEGVTELTQLSISLDDVLNEYGVVIVQMRKKKAQAPESFMNRMTRRMTTAFVSAATVSAHRASKLFDTPAVPPVAIPVSPATEARLADTAAPVVTTSVATEVPAVVRPATVENDTPVASSSSTFMIWGYLPNPTSYLPNRINNTLKALASYIPYYGSTAPVVTNAAPVPAAGETAAEEDVAPPVEAMAAPPAPAEPAAALPPVCTYGKVAVAAHPSYLDGLWTTLSSLINLIAEPIHQIFAWYLIFRMRSMGSSNNTTTTASAEIVEGNPEPLAAIPLRTETIDQNPDAPAAEEAIADAPVAPTTPVRTEPVAREPAPTSPGSLYTTNYWPRM